ncbi:hypothetical protein GJ496_005262 [Pomphorhynchus laevis]|nr:hypothetical protein GJ496_005262 [Pomphorhynchus laevis]
MQGVKEVQSEIHHLVSLLESFDLMTPENDSRNTTPVIQQIIESFQQLDLKKDMFTDVFIPEEVIRYIDNNINPELYSREVMQRAYSKNQDGKGKFEAISKFREVLVNNLSKKFPLEFMKYMNTSGDRRY